jgi:hypothetical protein
MVSSVFIYMDNNTKQGSFVFSGVNEKSLDEMRMIESMAKVLVEQLGRACIELEIEGRVRLITGGSGE